MIIFINDNRRNSEFKFKKKKGEGMQMLIPSAVDNTQLRVKFDFSENIKGVYGDIEIHGYDIIEEHDLITCTKLTNYTKDEDVENVYAILNSRSIAPGDILIPESLKSKINLIKVIENYDVESDYKSFISKKYLISFPIKKGEEITLYKGYAHSSSPVEALTFKWYNSDEQFHCEIGKPKKPYAKNLVSLHCLKA